VLVELEVVPEPEDDPPLAAAELSAVELPSGALAVVPDPLVVGDEVTTHDVVGTVGLVEDAVDPVLDDDADAVVSVAAWLRLGDATDVAVEVADESPTDGAAHAPVAEAPASAEDPVPVSEVELDFELISPDAPLEGLRPAPPAVGLW
jgi:hypothetical protein